MDTTESKNALDNALLRTCDLIDMFESVMRKDVYVKKDNKISHVSEKAKPAAEAPEVKPVVPKVIREDDPRYDMSLEDLKKDCSVCTRCRLCSTRKNTVFGEGCDDRPDVLVIGEGPGETEDNTGRPFVGKAGQYLDKWLESISLTRDRNVYIANIVKCRPPENRDPMDDEKKICSAYVKQQINLIKPKAVLCLGKPSSSFMTGKAEATMGELRGHFCLYDNSIPMICTYHPAAVLRNPELKRDVWNDLKKLAMFLNLEIHTKR